MRFSFNVIAHTVESDLSGIAKDIAKVVSDAGHVLDKIIYTDDNGEKTLTPALVEAGDVLKTIIPASTPIVDTVETVADDAANDIPPVVESGESLIEKIEDDVKEFFHHDTVQQPNGGTIPPVAAETTAPPIAEAGSGNPSPATSSTPNPAPESSPAPTA